MLSLISKLLILIIRMLFMILSAFSLFMQQLLRSCLSYSARITCIYFKYLIQNEGNLLLSHAIAMLNTFQQMILSSDSLQYLIRFTIREGPKMVSGSSVLSNSLVTKYDFKLKMIEFLLMLSHLKLGALIFLKDLIATILFYSKFLHSYSY